MINFLEYSKRVQKKLRFPFSIHLPYVNPSALYGALRDNTVSKDSILLESSKIGFRTGRYSFILLSPFAAFSSRNNESRWIRNKRTYVAIGDPLKRLQRILNRHESLRYEGLPPFVGGPAGFLSYELKDQIEKRKYSLRDEFRLPDIYLCFYDKVIAIDHKLKTTQVIISTEFHRQFTLKKSFEKAQASLHDYAKRVAIAIKESTQDKRAIFILGSEERLTPKQKFIKMVASAKKYIRHGDIFQANLSHCLKFEFEGDPFGVYLKQKKMNPTSFAVYADFGPFQIISASPERLVESNGERVSTRPIAGTRPRSKNSRVDEKFSAELKLSGKERAEHVMLLDLERNDLGRVCEYGSVKVDQMMTVEKYSHVQHIVSNVSGKLKKNIDATDLIRAVFPGGTITGAPKVRAMQIIDELEQRKRGIYTGSIGYISFCGGCDWNIVIRTMFIQNNKGYLQVGAGIVSDSDANKEYDETIQKAVSFLEMLRA